MKKFLFVAFMVTFINIEHGSAAEINSANPCDSIRDTDSIDILKKKDCHIEGILLKDLPSASHTGQFAFYIEGEQTSYAEIKDNDNFLELYMYGAGTLAPAGTIFKFNTARRSDCLSTYVDEFNGVLVEVGFMTWAGVNARSSGLGVYGNKIGDYRTRFKNLLTFKIKPGFYQ